MSIADQKIIGYEDSISALPDKIENNAAWLKAKFDGRTDKEVKEKHNGLIDALADKTAAAGIGAAEGETATTVQAALADRYRKSETYSKTETNEAIEEKMAAIGAGDMAASTYDPEGKQLPYLPASEGMAKADYGGSADGVVAAADNAGALGDVAAADLMAMLPPIGDIAFGFYRISYPGGDVNAKTFPWVNFDDDLDPEVYPQLYALYGDSLSSDAAEGMFNLSKLADRFPLVSASNLGEVGGNREITLTAEQIPPMSIDLKLDGQLIYGTEGGTGTGRLTSISKVSTPSGSSKYVAHKSTAASPIDILGPYIKMCAHIRAS